MIICVAWRVTCKGLWRAAIPLCVAPETSIPDKTMKTILLSVAALTICSCETTTIVKPEPTTMTESVRRTSSSSYSTPSGYSTVPAVSTTTETRSVTAE